MSLERPLFVTQSGACSAWLLGSLRGSAVVGSWLLPLHLVVRGARVKGL